LPLETSNQKEKTRKRKKKNNKTKRKISYFSILFIILFSKKKKNPQHRRKNNKEIKHFYHSLTSIVAYSSVSLLDFMGNTRKYGTITITKKRTFHQNPSG